METTFIYALCEPGTRTVRYIGKANKPKRRFAEHLNSSVKAKTYLGNWIRSLSEKPNLILLCEVPIDQWEAEEMRYISAARMLGMKLVNGSNGGEGAPNPSAEIRAKMSASLTGKKQSPEICAKKSVAMTGDRNPMFGRTGEKSPNFGRKPSLEARANMSAAQKGKRASIEAKANMSAAQAGEKNAMFGKYHTPETCAKISASQTGKKASLETKARLSSTNSGDNNPMSAASILRRGEKNPNLGKKASPETCIKMSVAMKGEKHPNYGKKTPPETRAKQSAAMTGEKHPNFRKKRSPETCAKISATKKLQQVAREKEQSHE